MKLIRRLLSHALITASVLCLLALAAALAVEAAPTARQDPQAAQKEHASSAVGTELPTMRTRTSRTFERPDGTRVTRIYQGPVNFKGSDGRWQPIDNRLRDDGQGGVENTANAYGLKLPGRLSDGPVRISEGGDWVSFQLRHAASGNASVTGDAARFASVEPNVDVTYDAGNGGVKETVILKDASAPDTFEFGLDSAKGLTPKVNEAGGVDFVDGSGHARLSFQAPFMRDAAGEVSRKVHYDVSSGGKTLTLAADSAWLHSPQRQYPVQVDPTYLEQGANRDCEIASGSTADTSLCGSGNLAIGSDGRAHRALLQFLTDQQGAQLLHDDVVTSARLRLWTLSEANATNVELSLHGLTRDFSTAATWNKADSTNAWTTAGGDYTAQREAYRVVPTSFVGDWTSIGAARLVQGWLNGSVAERGVLVKATNETVNNLIQFARTGPTNQSQWPYLEIVHTPRLGTGPAYTMDAQRLDARSQLSVNVANGNLHLSSNDITIAGTGLDLNMSREFNTMGDGYNGELGRGWQYTIGRDVKLSAPAFWDDSRLLHMPDGSFSRFDRLPAGSDDVPTGDRSYRSPAGINAKLVVHQDNTATLTFNGSGLGWEFDSGGCLTKIVDKNGNHIDLTYSGSELSSVKDTQGRTLTVNRVAGHPEITDVSDVHGRHWKYAYTTNPSSGHQNLSTYTDPDGKQTLYEYDSNDNITKITDARGNQTRITYASPVARVSSVVRVLDTANPTDPTKNPTTTYSYGSGQTVVTDPRGNSTTSDTTDGKTTYLWDNQDRVTKVTNALGQDAAKTYTPNSDADTFTDQAGTANSALTTLHYDLGGTDPTNNLTGSDGPAGEKTQIDYSSTVDADGGSLANNPQAKFWPSKATDAQGNQQLVDYDQKGNLRDVKDGTTARNQATLTYNSNGTVATAMDGNGNKTTYSYDTAGNLTRVTPQPLDPGTGMSLGSTTLTYDDISRVKTVTDNKGIVSTYTYDGEDRVTRVDLSTAPWFSFSYDNNGNMTSRSDYFGNTSSYVFDALNRRTQETFPGSRINNYAFDLNSQLSSLTDGGGRIDYTYDAIDRVKTITDPGAEQIAYAHDDTGKPRVQTATFPGGWTERSEFDLSGKPTKLVLKNNAGTVQRSYDYTYDQTAQNGSSTQGEVRTGVTDNTGRKTAYSYDQDGQLKQAHTTDSGGSLVEDLAYQYDKASNRTKKIRTTATGATTTTFAYNRDNQLCWKQAADVTSPSCASPPTGATTYTFDEDGNAYKTDGSTQALGYAAFQRTVSIGGNTVGYLSPTQGEVSAYGSTTFQNNVFGLGSQTTGTNTTYYVRNPDTGAVVGQRRFSGSTLSGEEWYFQDALGSTSDIFVLSATSPAKSYSYDPDGSATATGSGAPTDILFDGGYRAPAAGQGLIHFGRRWYDPALARWTQPDPLDQSADLRQGNPYQYAGNDPINSIDPLGQRACHTGGRSCPLQNWPRNNWHWSSGISIAAGFPGGPLLSKIWGPFDRAVAGVLRYGPEGEAFAGAGFLLGAAIIHVAKSAAKGVACSVTVGRYCPR